MSDSSLRPSWDWDDPAVRSYPRLKAKVVLGFLVGILALGAYAYFVVGDDTESAFARVSAVIVGWVLAYPLVVGVMLGNIKRLSPPPAQEPDEARPGRTR